jgi:hypothetical protein
MLNHTQADLLASVLNETRQTQAALSEFEPFEATPCGTSFVVTCVRSDDSRWTLTVSCEVNLDHMGLDWSVEIEGPGESATETIRSGADVSPEFLISTLQNLRNEL